MAVLPAFLMELRRDPGRTRVLYQVNISGVESWGSFRLECLSSVVFFSPSLSLFSHPTVKKRRAQPGCIQSREKPSLQGTEKLQVRGFNGFYHWEKSVYENCAEKCNQCSCRTAAVAERDAHNVSAFALRCMHAAHLNAQYLTTCIWSFTFPKGSMVVFSRAILVIDSCHLYCTH